MKVVHYAERGWPAGSAYCAVFQDRAVTATQDWKQVTCRKCLKDHARVKLRVRKRREGEGL